MRKYIETFSSSKYPMYNPNGKGHGLNKVAFKKTEAMIFADSVEKKHPDNEVIVVIGVTGAEFYGSNDNGDGFPVKPSDLIKEEELLQNHYKKFEDNAHVYYQHDDAAPPIGAVLKAFWNEEKKWVELVIEIFHDCSEQDVLERARSGEMLGVSMGCDVEHDICSYCGNKAPTIKQHCTHIKNELNQIKDGKVVMMLCPSPAFYDISIVTVPADAITNSIYRKVASLGPKVDHTKSAKLADKFKKTNSIQVTAVQKLNNIYKRIDTGDILVQNKIKPLLQEELSELGLSDEPVLEEIVFFSKLGLPYSIIKMANKTGISKEDILKQQEELIEAMKTDNAVRGKIEGLVKSLTKSNRKPQVSEEALELLPNSNSLVDTGFIDMEPTAKVLALFNIINKLSILGENNFIKSKLAKENIKNDDITEIVLMEHLLY